MAAFKFRLKGRDAILKLGKTPNAHQVAVQGRVSWPTVSKYLSENEATRSKMASVDLTSLYHILTDGLGLTEQDALNLRLGDIFEVTEAPAK